MATYNFNYRIETNDGAPRKSYQVAVELRDNYFNKIVEAVKANGGFAVELDDVVSLGDFIFDQALSHFDFVSDLSDYGSEYFWDNNRIVVEQPLPEELVKDVEAALGNKSMFFDYYFIVDGVESQKTAHCTISNKSFDAMVEAMAQLPENVQPFDFLKTFAPKAYEEIANAVLANAEQSNAYLKSFPYQVYEQITL